MILQHSSLFISLRAKSDMGAVITLYLIMSLRIPNIVRSTKIGFVHSQTFTLRPEHMIQCFIYWLYKLRFLCTMSTRCLSLDRWGLKDQEVCWEASFTWGPLLSSYFVSPMNSSLQVHLEIPPKVHFSFLNISASTADNIYRNFIAEMSQFWLRRWLLAVASSLRKKRVGAGPMPPQYLSSSEVLACRWVSSKSFNWSYCLQIR